MNGEVDFYDIMRKMLPSASGQSIILFPGQTYNFQWSYQMDASWQANQIRNLIFVQSGSEILGAAIRTRNFTMVPNPAFRIANQGQSQSGTYKIKIPVVKSGYNSPVTLTAEVVPPTSGITTSFSSGNVISNFPDSVTIQVSSTSSVPTGAYQIVVTGTNGAGNTHKTSVQYLVGESYVTTGTNRADVGLQYKIDGSSYSSNRMFTWNIGSQHLLQSVTPQTFGSTRYLFQSWSNSGPDSQTVTINAATNYYTVNYKTQFKVITTLTPSDIPATITGGNSFYDSATAASISISPLQVQYQGFTYYFQRWEGTGNGSYTGINPSPQITMFNPVVENAVWDTTRPIGIKGIGTEIPKEYSLHQNYPNPFNPATVIKFDLPKDGNLSLKVYDIIGNEVAVIYDGYKQAGYYEADFNGFNFASGVYFYKLTAGNYTAVKRMVLVK